MSRVKSLGEYEVRVGVPESKSARTDDSELNNAQVAAVNEYGSLDGHIPERSFMRSSVRENRAKHAKLLMQAARRVAEGKDQPVTALHRVGFIAAADVKDKIATGPFLENAGSTKRKKMREHPDEEIKPLIDKGQLIASIDHVVVKAGTK